MLACDHHNSVPWRLYCWAFGLLALLGLAGCGASDQGAGRAADRAPPTAALDTSAKDMQPSSAASPPVSPSMQSVDSGVPTPAAPPPTSLGTSATAPATTASANTAAWQTYRSAQGGFQVDYPTDWAVSERSDTSATLTTTFAPPDGAAGIAVIVRPGGPTEDNSDIPNVRCQPVMIGGLAGKRCFDTIAFSISTTLVGQDKTYTIAASRKRADPSIYEHLLESFVAGP